MNINELKKKSEAKLFASVLGKSTMDSQSQGYKLLQNCVRLLINEGFGIIHGGYAGGAMSAASDAANEEILKLNLPLEINIGVPQAQHDGLWDRVESAVFVDAANDIYDRLRVVVSGDIALVASHGGDGTELEENIIFHENIIKMGMLASGKETKKPTPIIFLCLPGDTDWETLIRTKMSILDTSVKLPEQYDWIYFVSSIETFSEVVNKLKNTYLN